MISMNIGRGVVALTLMATLFGCSPPEIKMNIRESGGRFFVAFKQDWGLLFFSRKKPSCIRDFYITKSDASHRGSTSDVWTIIQGGPTACLSQVELGKVPDDFREEALIPTDLNGVYHLTAVGAGFGSQKVIIRRLPVVRYALTASN